MGRICPEARRYPLRQPEGWKVKYPRWMLQLPVGVESLYVTYLGVQPRHEQSPAKGIHTNLHQHIVTEVQKHASTIIQSTLDSLTVERPELWEKFYVEAGYDLPDTEVWVFYWTDSKRAEAGNSAFDASKIINSLKLEDQHLVGVWQESFAVSKDRFETVYSGSDYRPGLASLQGASQVTHTFTGYWGAARDRLPASAQDNFLPSNPAHAPNFHKNTRNRTASGKNEDTILHIRSGQFWENCSKEEREAYESDLEPVLRQGMAFLEDNATESGDFGLRFMRNIVSNPYTENGKLRRTVDSEGNPQLQRETCSAGFFRSLGDLENWAAKHKTHHKIFHGAHAHSTRFGKETFKMRTWHEVSILEPGQVSFKYVNCEPRTGLLPFVTFRFE